MTMAMELIRHIAGLYSGKAIKGDFTQIYITGNEIWMAQQVLAEQAEGAQGERERFEVEMLELFLPIERDSHGAYVSDHVRHLWSGWELRAALAQPSQIRCQCCGYLVTDSEHRSCLRAAQQPSPAPELERTEVAGYLAAGAFYHPDRAVAEAGARAVLGSCGNAEAMITVAQHDRTVEALKKEAARSEQHRNDQADLIVSLRTEVIALRARAVVVPPLDYRDDKFAEGWNSCIDEIADLNGKVVSEGLLRRLSALFPTEMGDDGSGRAGWLPHVRETVAELRALLGEGKES